MNVVGLEFRKLHRKRLWILLAVGIGFELTWALMALTLSLGQATEVPRDTSLVIAQVAQVHGIFAPILITVIASRLASIEHDGGMLPVIFAANQSPASLFQAKFITTVSLATATVVISFAAVLIFGAFRGIAADWTLVAAFFLGCVLANLAVAAIQLFLALVFVRQAVTLCVGVVGGLVGSFAGFMAPTISVFVPWQYVGLVTPVRMEVIDGRIAGFPLVENLGIYLAIVGAVGVAAAFAGRSIFQRLATR